MFLYELFYKKYPLTGILVILFIIGCNIACTIPTEADAEISSLSCQVLEVHPYDTDAYTQGLVWQDGFLYVGTGLYGSSSLRKTDLETGKILQQITLSDNFFGEGITIFEDRIYQLTWKEQTGFVYDLETFQLLEIFSYEHEGWGITHDGESLIISDGTSLLRFVNPFTFQEIKQIEVFENEKPVFRINELEYVKGKIYANIWQTDKIAMIDAESGKVNNWLDLAEISNLVKIDNSEINVLNGIAYNRDKDYFFITGKLWPKVFKIKITDNFAEKDN